MREETKKQIDRLPVSKFLWTGWDLFKFFLIGLAIGLILGIIT